MTVETGFRVLDAALNYLLSPTFLGLICLLIGWLLGAMLGISLSNTLKSPRIAYASRRIGPFIGVAAALPLAYKLVFLS